MIEVYRIVGKDISNEPELVELFEVEDIEAAKADAERRLKESGDEHYFDIPDDAPHSEAGLRYWASDIPF